MPFQSTAQQRWAFATDQPFAEEWAKQTDFAVLPKRKRKRKKEIALKHGKHNQATHGRKGPAGQAGQQAYQQARSTGLSVAEARSAGRNATQAKREEIRARDRQRRIDGLKQREATLRKLADKASTEKKRATLLARADNLAARAAGQPVPNRRQTTPQPTTQPKPTRQPAAPDRQITDRPERGRRNGDQSRAYGDDPNRQYVTRHRLVDMSEIQASNTANGGINPNYDPKLQPRDRTRSASQAQIDRVASKLNPDVMVTDFHRIDAGSPIIDQAGNVLSGNGRTLALQRAQEIYPDQYRAYRDRIKEEAAKLGIDPAEVDRMQNPVLVRELIGNTDPAAFAREANSSGTLRMSPLEQAKVDATTFSNSSFDRLVVRDGDDIDRALRNSENKNFINDFLRTVPDNERATLLTRTGELNQIGLYRLKAAIYTKAFQGAAGERMAESMLESLDPSVRSVQNGISGALPAVGKIKALIDSGARSRDLDITSDFAAAVDALARIKDNPYLTANTPANKVVEKYLSQTSMFDRELTPLQERLLRHVDKISRKPTEVRDFLQKWADFVERQQSDDQIDMFGNTTRLSKEEMLDYLIRED